MFFLKPLGEFLIGSLSGLLFCVLASLLKEEFWLIARLVLEDGEVFDGKGFGSEGTAIGQVICHTGLVGYEAVVTDPSMRGNIVAMTYPLIGNYGINKEEFESKTGQASGLVLQEISKIYSNWTGEQCLASFARKEGIVGISGVDTRRLALHVREYGEQKGIITTSDESVEQLLRKMESMDIEHDPVSKVTTEVITIREPQGCRRYDIGILDLGVTRSLVRQILSAGAKVTIYPAATSAREILQTEHDGVVVAGGPGTPAQIPHVVDTVRQLLGKLPVFGVDLGHLVMAVSCGAGVSKLRVGHHGANKAIRYLGEETKLAITWQNHSFAVDKDSVRGKSIEILAENLIDGSVEALSFGSLSAFSVQYRPNEHENDGVSYEVKRFLELASGC